MTTKAPNPVDKYVGSRGAHAADHAWHEQEKLGDSLGLTFQQVQKYEKGTNRIGASRLQQISEILQVPVSFLFEGGPADRMRSRVLAKSTVAFVCFGFSRDPPKGWRSPGFYANHRRPSFAAVSWNSSSRWRRATNPIQLESQARSATTSQRAAVTGLK